MKTSCNPQTKSSISCFRRNKKAGLFSERPQNPVLCESGQGSFEWFCSRDNTIPAQRITKTPSIRRPSTLFATPFVGVRHLIFIYLFRYVLKGHLFKQLFAPPSDAQENRQSHHPKGLTRKLRPKASTRIKQALKSSKNGQDKP